MTHDPRLRESETEDPYGTYLRQRRVASRLTQRDLAGRVGIDFTYLSKIENGHLAPPAEATIRQIAAALGDDPDEHLARARKVPVNLRSAVARYPKEATMLLRALSEQPLTKQTYEQLLRTVRRATTDAPSSTVPARPADRSGSISASKKV